MKFYQSFRFFLTIFSLSHLPSICVNGKKHSNKGSHHDGTKNGSSFVSAPRASSLPNANERATSGGGTATTASSSDVLVVSSSSLLRRDLARSPSDFFFFEDCSDVCAQTGGVSTKVYGSCCKGGISYLKVNFTASIAGTISLDLTAVANASGINPLCALSRSQSRYRSKGSKANNGKTESGSELRLVPCDDPCVKEPFHGHSCNSNQVIAPINTYENICFAMIDPLTNKVSFATKMPTNMDVWFVSDQGEVWTGTIHTSCSRPLSHPWGVSLVDQCGSNDNDSSVRKQSGNGHVQIDDTTATPFLAFVDGISTKYFEAVEMVLKAEDTESYTQNFSIGFEHCGCTCKNFYPVVVTDAPTVSSSDGPSPGPSFSTSIPTAIPSNSPTPDPSSNPSQKPSKAPTSSPSRQPTFEPTNAPVVTPMSRPTTSPTTATVDSSSSGSSSTSSEANRGPEAPSSSTLTPSCSSSCLQYISTKCVFIGTNDVCSIGGNAPNTDDTSEEDNIAVGATATLFPTFPITWTTTETGKGAKAAKGKGGSGKGDSGKSGKKAEKGDGFGKGKAGGKSQKSKGNKGKGEYHIFDSGKKRHLKEIEYHQSRIEYYQELLKSIED